MRTVLLLLTTVTLVLGQGNRQGNREDNLQNIKPKDTLVVFGAGYEDDGVSAPDDLVGLHRYSTGDVWPEFLAEQLNMHLQNYAVAGALTEIDNLYFKGWSGSRWQVEYYLKHNPVIPKNVLIGFASGAINEQFVDPASLTDTVVNTMVSNVIEHSLKPLIKAGATAIFVTNLPDYTTAPAFQPGGNEGSTTALNKLKGDAVVNHNTKMASALKTLATQNPTVQIIAVDFYKMWADSIKTKEYKTTYGFACDPTVPGLESPSDVYKTSTSKVEDMLKYAFYDAYHPASGVHFDIANSIAAQLKAAGIMSNPNDECGKL